MPSQLGIFGESESESDNRGGAMESEQNLPEGFRYQAELLTAAEETALLEQIRDLAFREFEFHGYTGKRQVVSFGWQYDFAARRLQKVDDMPAFLEVVRRLAADFAGLRPDSLQHVLATEYGPGAAIGWHRDRGVFEEVVGISLFADCTFRLRRSVGAKWERVNLVAAARDRRIC